MLRTLIRDRRGNVAILSAFLLTGIIGVTGLAVEFSNGLVTHTENQRVADLAAIAGGTVYASSNSSTNMSSASGNIVALNGLVASDATTTLVNSPSGDGNQAVEVQVQTSVPLMLSRVIWSNATLPVTATAYAELAPSSSGCILALDKTANQAITISGSATVQAPKCDVVSNSSSSSSLDMSGSARLTTPCTITVGQQVTTTGLTLNTCSKPTINATASADPYASLPNPAVPGSCLTLPNPPTSIPPGYYCSGINLSTTASFQSGFYYVKGNLAFQGGSNVTGSGVTFFVDKSGTTAISGSATVNISAPTSGTYAGVLLYGDRAGTTSNNNNISGSSSSVLQGALYYPTQNVTFSGGSSTPSACTEIIGDKITFSGSAYVGNNCSGTGVKSIVPAGTLVATLVQ